MSMGNRERRNGARFRVRSMALLAMLLLPASALAQGGEVWTTDVAVDTLWVLIGGCPGCC